jgi:flagellar protein FlaF
MSEAAKAYAWSARATASPRDIEAQALLKAAGKLQNVFDQWDGSAANINEALLFNRKLWSILLSAAISDDNPQAIEIRQNIANIGTFVMTQTIELQLNPQREMLKPLIDINCNLAAGLSGRG